MLNGKMKILYIDHYAGSPKIGMEFRPFHMAREWVKAGNEVTIVGSSFSHYRPKQVDVYGQWAMETLEGVRFLWLKTNPYQGNGVHRVRNIIEFLRALNNLEKFLPGEKFDVIIASSTYPYDNYIAARLAKKWHAAHIFEVHDLWPLSPMELGGYKKLHPFIMITQKAEDDAYKKADAVVSMLPRAESYMLSRGLASEKFFFVPNGVTREEIESEPDPLPEPHIRKIEEIKKGRFLVGYAGAHGLANALDSFLAAAANMPDIGFVLIGGGTEKERLVSTYGRLDNVLFLDSVPKSQIPSFLSLMDLVYIGLQHRSLFRFGISPNKLMDYMLAGKPVICAIKAGNDIVTEAGCGISIEPENPGELMKALSTLKNKDRAQLAAMGKNGRDYILAHHDYSKLAAQMSAILASAYERKTNSLKQR